MILLHHYRGLTGLLKINYFDCTNSSKLIYIHIYIFHTLKKNFNLPKQKSGAVNDITTRSPRYKMSINATKIQFI